MYESEKIGKDTGILGNQTRRIIEKFKDFLKTMSIYRKVVLGITPSTTFVYNLRAGVLKKEHQLFLPVPGMVCVYRVVLDSAASSATMMALGWNCRMLAGT